MQFARPTLLDTLGKLMNIRTLFLLATCLTGAGCAPESGTEPSSATVEADTLRFAVMTFAHETCTFCPGGDSDIERWTRLRDPYVGDEIFTAGSYIPGFVRAMEE